MPGSSSIRDESHKSARLIHDREDPSAGTNLFRESEFKLIGARIVMFKERKKFSQGKNFLAF